MSPTPQGLPPLSRRERQIMDAVFARGEASVSDVVAAIEDAPSRTAVRTILRILEEKGHLRHREAGREYVYSPTRSPRREGRSALRRVLDTFYQGSIESAVAAHLADARSAPSPDELARIEELIRAARAKGE